MERLETEAAVKPVQKTELAAAIAELSRPKAPSDKIPVSVQKFIDYYNSPENQARFAEIEAYLAGEDPYMQIMTALNERVKTSGFSSLNAVEQGYYAVGEFLGASVNGLLDHYLRHVEQPQHAAMLAALRAIDEPELVAEYQALLAGGPRQESDENWFEVDDRDWTFTSKQFELEAKIDAWAEQGGLTPKTARRKNR